MNLYVDSSSFLKVFLREPGSAEIRDLVTLADSLSTSMVAWPEVRAGLARAFRGVRVSSDEYDLALGRLR